MVKSILTIIAGLFTLVPNIIKYFKEKRRLKKLRKINELDKDSDSTDIDDLM